MTKLERIQDFLQKDEPIAVLGVSRNKRKFGRQVYEKLKSLGYSLLPINSIAEKIGDDLCYNSIDTLPNNVNKLIILSPKEFNDEAVKMASDKGISKIWVQQMCDTPNTLDLANDLGLHIITNECIFMFAEPKGIHSLHRFIKRLAGSYPN